ncbi:MAG: SWIM zinc finger family protein, partial [Candidatus Fonsibacter sp.]
MFVNNLHMRASCEQEGCEYVALPCVHIVVVCLRWQIGGDICRHSIWARATNSQPAHTQPQRFVRPSRFHCVGVYCQLHRAGASVFGIL